MRGPRYITIPINILCWIKYIYTDVNKYTLCLGLSVYAAASASTASFVSAMRNEHALLRMSAGIKSKWLRGNSINKCSAMLACETES